MASPNIHAKNSSIKHGGTPEDYIDIHKFMDSSKASFSDARHRTITHNIFFCVEVIPRVFGDERINSEGKTYSPKDIAEEHCIEDMGTVPTIQDFLENMKIQKWMQGEANVEKPNLNVLEELADVKKEIRTVRRSTDFHDSLHRKLD